MKSFISAHRPEAILRPPDRMEMSHRQYSHVHLKQLVLYVGGGVGKSPISVLGSEG